MHPVRGTVIVALLMTMMRCKLRCWCIFSAAAFETAKESRGRSLMAGKTGKLTLTSFPRHVNHWKFAFGKPQLPRFETDSEWCHFSYRLIDFRSSQSILVVILPGHESQYRFEVRYLSRPHNFDPVWSPSLNPRSNLPAWSCRISARSRDRGSHNSFHRRLPEMHRFDAMRIKVGDIKRLESRIDERLWQNEQCQLLCVHLQLTPYLHPAAEGLWSSDWHWQGGAAVSAPLQLHLHLSRTAATPAPSCKPSRRLVIFRLEGCHLLCS